MTTLRGLTDEVLLTLHGYGVAPDGFTYLSGALGATATSVEVADGSNIGLGLIEIDSELMYVNSVSNNTLTVQRGAYGTEAGVHASGARVVVNPLWPRSRVQDAINDAIEGTYPILYGVGSTSFAVNGVVTTFDLPADCEQVLKVTADTIGPTNEQQSITRYTFNSTASDEFASGNYITLGEPVFPGRSVTVTYRKAPTAIASSDDFTVSGLRTTAEKCVKLAAVSDLVAFMDTARLNVDTAQAYEYDERNSVGAASKLSLQLLQRYELELERERRRLAATTPVPISVRTR